MATETPEVAADGTTFLTDTQWAHMYQAFQRMAVDQGNYSGFPMPVQDSPLHLAPGHPYRDRLEGQTLGTIGKPDQDPGPDPDIVNRWRIDHHPKWKLSGEVVLFRDPGDPKTKHVFIPGMRENTQLRMALQTFDVAMTWSTEAEERAMARLRELITPVAYHYYLTTGGFLESSPRSQVTYWFRRLRPTLALRPDGPANQEMRIIAALCLHPIAWYGGTWAGAMVPTDDLLAHLLLMRGDEHRYWRHANQHEAWTVEAGL